MNRFTLILCALLAGCARFSAWEANPNTALALQGVTSAAVAFIEGNDIQGGLDALSASALLVRSLQSTPTAANPVAVAQAVTGGGASAKVATSIANAIKTLQAAGATADAANEAVSKQIDQLTKPEPIK